MGQTLTLAVVCATVVMAHALGSSAPLTVAPERHLPLERSPMEIEGSAPGSKIITTGTEAEYWGEGAGEGG